MPVMSETKVSRRSRGEDAIYLDTAKNRYVESVSLGYGPDGKRIQRKVLGSLAGRIARHPGRQHAQGDPVAQTALSHAHSLRHSPRSCRQPAQTTRSDTPGKPRSTHAKWHWACR